MTATNHAVTGALIASLVPNPFLAIFLAFVSHFALDTLPHFDEAGVAKKIDKNKHVAMLAVDGVIATFLVAAMAVLSSVNPYILVGAGFVAVLPDAMWLRYYLDGTINDIKKYGVLARLHKRMQSRENIDGIWPEIFWLIFVLFIFNLAVLN